MIEPKEIKAKYLHTCTACKEERETESKNRPKYWNHLSIKRDAYDMQGNACASDDVEMVLCRSCAKKTVDAINNAFVPEENVHIVFDGPPGPESGRFIEVENDEGSSINFGEWFDRENGYWSLSFPHLVKVSKQ